MASVVALGAYMTIFVIIITNILIALFSETLNDKETRGHQTYNRAYLVIETSYDLPFSTMNMFVQLALFVWAFIVTPYAARVSDSQARFEYSFFALGTCCVTRL